MHTRGYARHLIVYRVLRRLLMPVIRSRLNLETREATIGRQFILLSNHNTDWDPIIASLAIRDHMYFVASEHIFSWGAASRIIRYLASPIPIFKGAPAAGTVLEVLERLRKGHNIAIFAEGDKSFSGRTERIEQSLGKLARTSNVSLVTFRIEGGYLSSPRWSDTFRKGRMRAGIVRIYDPETLKGMTTHDVNETISKDLYEDAYERQQIDKTEYKGRRLSEHAERVLFLCPGCHMTGSLHSNEDVIFCSCGLNVTIDSSGILHGKDVPFDNITAWDMWQREEVRRLVSDRLQEMKFSDKNVNLYEIGQNHERKLRLTGEITMTPECLRIGESDFSISKIPDMAVHGKQDLVFSCERINYEVKCDNVFNALKYLLLYRIIRGRD